MVSLVIGWMASWLVDDIVNRVVRCQGCWIVALLIGLLGGNVCNSLNEEPILGVLRTLKKLNLK